MVGLESDNCAGEVALTSKFNKTTSQLKELKIPLYSQASDVDGRLKRIADNQEILAKGQRSTEIDKDAIRVIRSRLNAVMVDCAPIDESKGVFDRELEQRVAQFQKRFMGSDFEVDGIVGGKTLRKLNAVLETMQANEKRAGSDNGGNNQERGEMSKPAATEETEKRQLGSNAVTDELSSVKLPARSNAEQTEQNGHPERKSTPGTEVATEEVNLDAVNEIDAKYVDLHARRVERAANLAKQREASQAGK